LTYAAEEEEETWGSILERGTIAGFLPVVEWRKLLQRIAL
jgi:hypothetical protein